MDLYLKDQVVVITGGASGIGQAIAKLFVEEGCRVAIWDRSVVADPSDPQPEVNRLCLGVDVTDAESVERAFCQTLSTFQRIDHLVHAAAVGSGKFGFPFTNLAPEDWQKVLNVNILGMVHVAHCLAPRLAQQRFGTMTFLGSIAGQIGSQTDPPYSASKAANINFMQCLAKDLAQNNVRVNIVNPGMVQTPLNQSVWRAWFDQQPADQRTTYEAWADAKIRSIIPLGRWQTVEDVANLVVFLASSRAANITGQCLNVDGGCVMHA